MRWRIAALALVALSACIGLRELAPPPDAGAKSVIVVFGGGADAVVYASDVSTTLADALPPFSGSSNAQRLRVLEYGCPLAGLGLASGVQRLAQDRPTSLPPPLAAFEGKAQGDWTKLDSVSAELEATLGRIRPERHLDCPSAVRFEIPGSISSAVGLKDGGVLVMTRAGEFFRVSKETGAQPLREVHGWFPGELFFGAHRTDETIWLSGVSSEVVRGTIERGRFELYAGQSNVVPHYWLTGSSEGSPFELFRFTDRGQLDRMAGTSTTWQTIVPSSDFPYPFFEVGGVAWVSEGEVAAVGTGRLVHYRNGAGFERLRPLSDPQYMAVASIPGLGVLLGDTAGSIFRLDGEVPVPFPLGPGAQLDEIRGLGPLGKGFLILTRTHAAYYRDALRPCLPDPITTSFAVARMADRSVAAAAEMSAVWIFTAPDASVFRGCSGPS